MPQPGPIYEIRVRGHFAPRWRDVFAPMSPHGVEGGVTILRGRICDQAALHGVLRRLERSGIELLALACIEEDAPCAVGV